MKPTEQSLLVTVNIMLKCGTIATFGTFKSLTYDKQQYKDFIKKYPISWLSFK